MISVNQCSNMVVSSIGYHNTGSSAVDDYLKEFGACIQTPFEKECRFVQDPDGISDLYYNAVLNWHRLNSGFALKRFHLFCKRYNRSYSSIFGSHWMSMVEEYINSLVAFKYQGYWHADIRVQNAFWKCIYYSKRVLQIIFKIPPWKWNLLPNEETYHICMDERKFLQHTIIFTNKLVEEASKGKKGFLLLEQLVSTTNIATSIKFFSNLKVIIVDRDPRDVYINNLLQNDNVLPKDPDQFCKVFADSRRTISKEVVENTNNLLYIKFEDLIYDYDRTTTLIRDFLGLSLEDHIYPNKHLKPEKSKKNTQLWLSHPEYMEKCRIIEKSLPDFLYNFP